MKIDLPVTNREKEISMTTYKDELTKSMTFISENTPAKFIGQQVLFHGNPMSNTVLEVDKTQLLEVPVFEETQMGMSLGIAMSGYTVVTLYPRWDFLICATNQLVNHVDKFKHMTGKDVNIIIRVGKGADKPLDPGHQHKGNYIEEFRSLCPNIKVTELLKSDDVYDAFKSAIEEGGIHLIVEYPELYNT